MTSTKLPEYHKLNQLTSIGCFLQVQLDLQTISVRASSLQSLVSCTRRQLRAEMISLGVSDEALLWWDFQHAVHF